MSDYEFQVLFFGLIVSLCIILKYSLPKLIKTIRQKNIDEVIYFFRMQRRLRQLVDEYNDINNEYLSVLERKAKWIIEAQAEYNIILEGVQKRHTQKKNNIRKRFKEIEYFIECEDFKRFKQAAWNKMRESLADNIGSEELLAERSFQTVGFQKERS